VAQLTGSSNGPLYLYRITNNGLPVGFFANRNHQGLLVAIGILLSGYIAATAIVRKSRSSALVLTGAAGTALLFLLFLLILGSRAGLLLGGAMMFPTVFMVMRALQIVRKPNSGSLLRDRRFRWGGLAAAIVVFLIFAGAYLFSRSLAFDRLVGKELGEDLRAAVVPIVLDLIGRFFPLGSGFGSFEALFMQAEPLDLLSPSYMNHAHNDWLEFVLEGGFAAVAIILVFMGWYFAGLVRVLRAKTAQFNFEKFTAAAIIAAFAAASVVDYPLRVPLLMSVFSIACGHLAARKAPI